MSSDHNSFVVGKELSEEEQQLGSYVTDQLMKIEELTNQIKNEAKRGSKAHNNTHTTLQKHTDSDHLKNENRRVDEDAESQSSYSSGSDASSSSNEHETRSDC